MAYGALLDEEGSLPISEAPETPATRQHGGTTRRLLATFVLAAAGFTAVAVHSRQTPTSVTTLAAPPSTKPEEAGPASKLPLDTSFNNIVHAHTAIPWSMYAPGH